MKCCAAWSGCSSSKSPRCWRASPSRPGCAAWPRSWWPRTRPPSGRPRPPTSASSCSIRRACSTTASGRCGRPGPSSCSKWRSGCGAAGPTPWPSCCRMPRAGCPKPRSAVWPSLDEQAVAALGFERLLIVRSAQKPAPAPAPGLLARTRALDAVDLQVHGAQQRTAGAGRQSGANSWPWPCSWRRPASISRRPRLSGARPRAICSAAVRQWLQR